LYISEDPGSKNRWISPIGNSRRPHHVHFEEITPFLKIPPYIKIKIAKIFQRMISVFKLQDVLKK